MSNDWITDEMAERGASAKELIAACVFGLPDDVPVTVVARAVLAAALPNGPGFTEQVNTSYLPPDDETSRAGFEAQVNKRYLPPGVI